MDRPVRLPMQRSCREHRTARWGGEEGAAGAGLGGRGGRGGPREGCLGTGRGGQRWARKWGGVFSAERESRRVALFLAGGG